MDSERIYLPAGLPVCSLPLSRGKAHCTGPSSFPLGRQDLAEGRLHEDGTRLQELELLWKGAFPGSLLDCKSILPFSKQPLCPPVPELYSILLPEWSFWNPDLVLAKYTSSTTPKPSRLRPCSGLPVLGEGEPNLGAQGQTRSDLALAAIPSLMMSLHQRNWALAFLTTMNPHTASCQKACVHSVLTPGHSFLPSSHINSCSFFSCQLKGHLLRKSSLISLTRSDRSRASSLSSSPGSFVAFSKDAILH